MTLDNNCTTGRTQPFYRPPATQGWLATVACPLEPKVLEVYLRTGVGVQWLQLVAGNRSDVECTWELAGRSLQGQRRQNDTKPPATRLQARVTTATSSLRHNHYRVRELDVGCDQCSDELYDLKQEAGRRSQREVPMHGGAGLRCSSLSGSSSVGSGCRGGRA